VVIGYALLDATWLIWKVEGTAQAHAVRLARNFGVGTLVAMAAVSAATPFLDYAYWQRWFEMPGVLLTAQVPILVVVAGFFYFRSLTQVLNVSRSPSHWAFSCSGSPGWGSAFSPLSCLIRSQFGMPRHLSRARSSCWSEPSSSFRSSWHTPPGLIGSFAARSARTGITDGQSALLETADLADRNLDHECHRARHRRLHHPILVEDIDRTKRTPRQ
jgi:hypothetical protein